jgi:hypothetical protein
MNEDDQLYYAIKLLCEHTGSIEGHKVYAPCMDVAICRAHRMNLNHDAIVTAEEWEDADFCLELLTAE